LSTIGRVGSTAPTQVAGFEAAGAEFEKDMVDRGVTVTTTDAY